MSDPDLYQLAVSLVVEAREILRGQCASLAALLEADAATVLVACPSTGAASDQGLDPVIAFDAARAQRLRELPAVATERIDLPAPPAP